jgi:hypothetical protein
MNKKPSTQQNKPTQKYKQLFYRNKRSAATPATLLLMGDDVRMFYNVMEKLRLMNPKTGLNSRRYGLVILHDYPFVYLDKEKGEMVSKVGTLFASVTRESFEKYFQISDKMRVEDKLNVPLMAFHHAYFIANDGVQEMMPSERSNLNCIRSINGQKHLQFTQVTFMGVSYVSEKIASTIFKLDFLTDTQSENLTKNVIERAKTPPATEKQQ